MVKVDLAERADIGHDVLRQAAADALGEPIEYLDGWIINRIREEDGAIDAYVPLTAISTAGVATDPDTSESLKKLIDAYAKETGGTGQRDPVVLGHVHSEATYMLDGFHRHDVQTEREETHLLATIEPNVTYEHVIKRRIEYAHTHTEIEMARQVEWMQSVWDRTKWAEIVPNILTALRAIQPDYAKQRDTSKEEADLIDSLDDAIYEELCDCISSLSKEWGYTPAEIRKKLSKVESFDKDLMHLVYQRQGAVPTGRIGLTHVEAITKHYPGEFDLQGAVVEIVITHELTSTQTETMLRELEESHPVSVVDLQKAAQKIDFPKLKKIVRAKSTGKNAISAVNRPKAKGETLSNSDLLQRMRDLLPDLRTDALDREGWTQADVDNAMEIAVSLGEILAELAESKEG